MPAGWVYMKKFFRRYSKSFSQHPNERHYFSDARQVALDDSDLATQFVKFPYGEGGHVQGPACAS